MLLLVWQPQNILLGQNYLKPGYFATLFYLKLLKFVARNVFYNEERVPLKEAWQINCTHLGEAYAFEKSINDRKIIKNGDCGFSCKCVVLQRENSKGHNSVLSGFHFFFCMCGRRGD